MSSGGLRSRVPSGERRSSSSLLTLRFRSSASVRITPSRPSWSPLNAPGMQSESSGEERVGPRNRRGGSSGWVGISTSHEATGGSGVGRQLRTPPSGPVPPSGEPASTLPPSAPPPSALPPSALPPSAPVPPSGEPASTLPASPPPPSALEPPPSPVPPSGGTVAGPESTAAASGVAASVGVDVPASPGDPGLRVVTWPPPVPPHATMKRAAAPSHAPRPNAASDRGRRAHPANPRCPEVHPGEHLGNCPAGGHPCADHVEQGDVRGVLSPRTGSGEPTRDSSARVEGRRCPGSAARSTRRRRRARTLRRRTPRRSTNGCS